MELKKYTGDIFEIAHQEGKDVGIAERMFISDLEQGMAMHGEGRDMALLGKQWCALDGDGKEAALKAYTDYAKTNYDGLCAAYQRLGKAGVKTYVQTH